LSLESLGIYVKGS